MTKTPNPPIERASTLLMEDAAALYAPGATVYGRGGLAVHRALEDAFTELEGGHGCALAPSGLAAITTAMAALTKPGDHALVTDSVYGPVRRFCTRTWARMGVETTFFAPRATGRDLSALMRANTALVVLESPGSLTLEVQDTPALAAAAHAGEASVVMDATWSAGLVSQPLALGCDVAVHAATKFASGGSDVFMGAIVSKDAAHAQRIGQWQEDFGAAVSPDDAYLVLRGMRAMRARFAAQAHNAALLARWLETRPEVTRVLWPALESHRDHALWQRDFTGAAPVFSFLLKTGRRDADTAFLNALQVFGLGFSYGGFESLAIGCDAQLRRAHPVADREDGDALIRLAIGLEPVEQLQEDLERALLAAVS